MSDDVTKLAGTCEAHCSRRHYLADELLRAERERDEARVALFEAQRHLAQVPYRPGLPSVEQVRAHEARGAVWQGWCGGRESPFCTLLSCWSDGILNSDGDDTSCYSSAVKWRPCLPDGTPCPWGDL